jgi:hypothetical protein
MPFFYLLRYGTEIRDHPIAEPGIGPRPGTRPATTQDETVGQAVPGYVPASKARLQAYEQDMAYLITGKVSTEKGEALPGAIVSVHSAGFSRTTYVWPAPMISQVCDNQGRYAIRLNSPARVFLMVCMQGFAPRQEEILIGEPGTLVRNYRLLPAPACAEGYVFDLQGAPIAGALVYVSLAGKRTPLDPTFSLNSTTTDSAGKYVLNGIPEEDVPMAAASHRNLEETRWIEMRAGDCRRVDFHLAAAIEVTFKVKNRRGEAIPHAYAGLSNYRGDSDSEGELRFPVPPDFPPFDCPVSAAGYITKIFLLDPKVPPPAVVLDDGPIFSAQVVTETEEAIEGARAEVENKVVFSDTAGRFSTRVSSASIRDITVSKPGFLERRLGSDLGKSLPEDGKIRLSFSAGGVFGRVIDAAGGVARRFRVSLSSVSGEPQDAIYERDFENDGGMFSVTDVLPGTYDLTIESLPYSISSPRQRLKNRVEIRKGFFFGEIQFRLTGTRPPEIPQLPAEDS